MCGVQACSQLTNTFRTKDHQSTESRNLLLPSTVMHSKAHLTCCLRSKHSHALTLTLTCFFKYVFTLHTSCEGCAPVNTHQIDPCVHISCLAYIRQVPFAWFGISFDHFVLSQPICTDLAHTVKSDQYALSVILFLYWTVSSILTCTTHACNLNLCATSDSI